jgi:hypothetical protein
MDTMNNGNENKGNGFLEKYKKYRGYVIGVILFLGVSAMYSSYTQQKDTVPQCNDPAVLTEIQHIFETHAYWTYYNFGESPLFNSNDTALSNWVERKPLDKQLRKRFCEAAFPNGNVVNYDIQMISGSDDQFTVVVFPPNSNTE